MRYRTFGRTGWQVSEIGYGMWGMGGWTESDDDEFRRSLQIAVDLGCTFFDTAWGYGAGHSEGLLGELVRANAGKRLYTATKIPPKNATWPSRRGFTLDQTYPPDHIRAYTEKSLHNLGLDRVDLQQFHVWEDAWAHDERWQRAVDDLKREGLIGAIGISLNRWEPWNALETVRTGQIDAVQVIYNIFDQAPEDELFPLCRKQQVGVIARVPFDEGSLTGTLTSVWSGSLAEENGSGRRSYWRPRKSALCLQPSASRRRPPPRRALLMDRAGVGAARPDNRAPAAGGSRRRPRECDPARSRTYSEPHPRLDGCRICRLNHDLVT